MITRIGRDGTVTQDMYEGVKETLVACDMIDFYAMEYEPVQETKTSHIGVVMMHCDQNYMGLKMGPELAKRGYHTLGIESILSGDIDMKLKRLGRMVKYLKDKPEIEKIVLMGHSGGATLISAYQAIAENGPEIYQKDDMIYQCTLTEKPVAADGIMLIDANYGNGVMSLLSLDPAVKEEGNGMDLSNEYDYLSPDNGYDKNGAHYSQEFIKKYQLAQKRRNDALIAKALDRLDKIQRGEGNYVDDEPFIITAADQPKPNNRLLPQDLHLLSHTKGEYDLLHADGSTTHEQVKSVRTAEIDTCFSNTYAMGANKNTVVGFLSSQAIRTTDDFMVKKDEVVGVEWKSSYASPIGNIEDIHVPALFVGLTGGYEYLAAEMIYNHAPMEDKTIAFVEGASHMFFPNTAAEKTPGEFGDTEKTLFDFMAKWLTKFV